ncbi:hypothetical protein FIBSPDRAFT_905932, partial [Athelia psychrophila]
IGPLLLDPSSEIYDRSHVLQLGNLWYLAWNLGCFFKQTTPQLGGGVLGNMFAPEQQGQAPRDIDILARAAAGSTSIVDGAVAVAGFFFLSYPPPLLARKAPRIRTAQLHSHSDKGIPTHYKHIHPPFQDADHIGKRILANGLVHPFALFTREHIAARGVHGVLLASTASRRAALHRARGVGCASQADTRTMDKRHTYLKVKHGGAGRPEYRLSSMVSATVFLPVGLLIVGWTVEYRLFWIGPDIGIASIGAASTLIAQPIQAYVPDASALHAASVLAAVNPTARRKDVITVPLRRRMTRTCWGWTTTSWASGGGTGGTRTGGKAKAVGVLEKKANLTVVGGEVVIGKEAWRNVKLHMLVSYTHRSDDPAPSNDNDTPRGPTKAAE